MDKTRPIVVVDPGHGGSDPGAVNAHLSIDECEVNLDLALLFTLYAGKAFDVLPTRTIDKFVSLPDRAAVSNANDTDAFLSFHCNASDSLDANGFEVWTTPGQTKADALAAAIFNALKAAFPDRAARADYYDGDPDKEAKFYVLRHTNAPAVLIEFGFVSNDEEAAWLNDVLNQCRLSAAVAKAVTGWLKGSE
jgi:N-acetylmuramoyl-L-alanine amidase